MRPERAATEIVALHDAFTAWIGRGEGDFARFEAAFAEGFTLIQPSGAMLDRAGVLAMLQRLKGARGPAFIIACEDIRPLHVAGDQALMHYTERQGATLRRSTALFRDGTPHPLWLAVQETWITPPPG
jgi:hypothetical protein